MAIRRIMPRDARPGLKPILSVTIARFKAHRDEHEFEFRPLTVLAGANSAGKSSIMQALLLLKQTADDVVNRGGLKLNGAHVRFEQFTEMAWHGTKKDSIAKDFVIGLNIGGVRIRNTYTEEPSGFGAVLQGTRWVAPGDPALESGSPLDCTFLANSPMNLADFCERVLPGTSEPTAFATLAAWKPPAGHAWSRALEHFHAPVLPREDRGFVAPDTDSGLVFFAIRRHPSRAGGAPKPHQAQAGWCGPQ